MRSHTNRVRSLAVALATALVLAACGSGRDSDSALDRLTPASRRTTTTTAAPKPRPTPTTTAAPAPTTTQPPQAVPVALKPFPTCDDATAHLRAHALKMVGPYGLPGFSSHTMAGDVIAMPAAGTAAEGSASAATPTPEAMPVAGYSSTNVQEAGVDEPDRVKTDGRRLLVLDGQRLHQFDVTGGGLRRASSLTLGGGNPSEVLLAGDRAVVLGESMVSIEGTGPNSETAPGDSRANATAIVWIVDLSNPSVMTVPTTLRFDGSYVSARQVDGIARLVFVSQRAPVYVVPEADTRAAHKKAKARNRAITAASVADDWLPQYRMVQGGPGGAKTVTSGRLCACDRTLHPDEFSGLGNVTVVTLDPANPQPDAAASVLGSGNVVYASTDSLYVATSAWSMAGPESAPLTEVHQFDISDPHTSRYVASGEVPGHIPDQWALSEHEGHLRVASTTLRDTRGSENGVTVLRPEGPALVPVGRVGGLGLGEEIHAVRYFGDVAFVVTFRRTDPLYALDLSDPAHPAVTGELKINGVSEYLHPVGDGRLVGVGQDADEQGNTLGVQVSLFDVSDTSAPRRIHAWPGARSGPQGTQSPVEWDHHAFLWWPESRFAVVPVQRWDDNEQESRSAAVVLSVQDTVAEVGRVTHRGRPTDRRDVEPTIDRSIVVGDSLYTVSPLGVLDSRLSDLADQTWVPLPA